MYALRTGRGQTESDPSAIVGEDAEANSAVEISNELDRIDEELRSLSAGLGRIMRIPSAKREERRKELVKERGRLIELYRNLPLEARAAKDRMFAIRAFHGSPHDFDRFDLSRIGTGEGAQAFGFGLYFAENELTAKSYQVGLAQEVFLDGKLVEDEDLRGLAMIKDAGQSSYGQTLEDIEAGYRQFLERLQEKPERNKKGIELA